MSKKWYFKLAEDNTILDVISYPHEGYAEVELDILYMPAGVNGGWWKLENGKLVEYPELKPADPETENQEKIAELEGAVMELTMVLSTMMGV